MQETLGINCNFMFDDWLQLSDRWSIIIGLWWALTIWWDVSTSYKFCEIIHVIYFFQIAVAMNCWSIMSWNCNLFWIKRKVCVLVTKKCSESILKTKECSLHIQLIESFNFRFHHQFNWLSIIINHRSITRKHYCTTKNVMLIIIKKWKTLLNNPGNYCLTPYTACTLKNLKERKKWMKCD